MTKEKGTKKHWRKLGIPPTWESKSIQFQKGLKPFGTIISHLQVKEMRRQIKIIQ